MWKIICFFLALLITMWLVRRFRRSCMCAHIRAYMAIERYNNSSTTLFEKYKGLATVQTVVDKAVENLVAESSLSNVFAVVGKPNHRSGVQLAATLDLQVSALLGAPFTYPGKTFTRGVTVNARSMKCSHAGLRITRTQFNKFVEILASTMLQCGVEARDVDLLAPKLRAMARDIVEVEA